jgi:hypothetical protein
VAGQVLGCLLPRTSVDHHCSIEMSVVVKSYTQGRIMQLNQNSNEYLKEDKRAGCLLIGICHRGNRHMHNTLVVAATESPGSSQLSDSATQSVRRHHFIRHAVGISPETSPTSTALR